MKAENCRESENFSLFKKSGLSIMQYFILRKFFTFFKDILQFSRRNKWLLGVVSSNLPSDKDLK